MLNVPNAPTKNSRRTTYAGNFTSETLKANELNYSTVKKGSVSLVTYIGDLFDHVGHPAPHSLDEVFDIGMIS